MSFKVITKCNKVLIRIQCIHEILKASYLFYKLLVKVTKYFSLKHVNTKQFFFFNLSNSKINQDWHQDIWTLSTLNAVYALANAIHKTLQAKCGTNYNGVCARVLYDSDVYNVTMSYMDSSNFTEEVTNLIFKFLDREADRPYYLMRYDGSGDAAKNVRDLKTLLINVALFFFEGVEKYLATKKTVLSSNPVLK